MVSGFVDSHAHPVDIRIPYPDYGDASLILGCSTHMSDWDTLRCIDDTRIVRFYGIHPWYSDEWNDESRNMLIALLKEDPGAGVGEIGLDSKRGIISHQIRPFREQLRIAEEFTRPVEIHMVGTEKEILDTLRDEKPNVPLILHSFNKESYSKALSELGCYMSINPRILSRSEERIRRLFSSIPEDRLLLETDAPFTSEQFTGMIDFVNSIAKICNTTADDLISMTIRNARRIIYG